MLCLLYCYKEQGIKMGVQSFENLNKLYAAHKLEKLQHVTDTAALLVRTRSSGEKYGEAVTAQISRPVE
jgi:hypothetical protein